MGELFIERGSSFRTTGISNIFIDEYLAGTKGDYVKVYLYMVRCLSDRNKEISVEAFAGDLNLNESDVLEAMRYWQEQNLITVCFNDLGEMSGIRINECVSKKSNEFIKPEKRKLKASDISAKFDDESFESVVFAVSTYLGKANLTPGDTNTLIYIMEDLKFDEDLVLFLVEHCVEGGRKRMSSIEKIAVTWAEAGISDVASAKEFIKDNNPNYKAVLKAFGITGRLAGVDEKSYINKWFDNFGFSTEIVLCACNRTIKKIHAPSFEYADKILTKWHKKGINSISGVEKDDIEFKKINEATFTIHKKEENVSLYTNMAKQSPSKVVNNDSKNYNSRGVGSFSNFQERDYSYEEMKEFERRRLARRG